MLSQDAQSSRQIMRARLAPPRVTRRIMRRPALEAELRECADYRLTLVRAGTGFGKTTALASLAGQNLPLVWYTLDETDAAPARFVAYLAAAFRLHFPKLALPVLPVSGDGNTAGEALDTLVNALHSHITQPTLLALDDFHTISHSPEAQALTERFIQHMPDDLRVIIATRQSVNWPAMVAWRAKGQMREISREALAFSPDETGTLFRETFGLQLAPAEIARLHDRTEGWPIALHLVWQSLRHKPVASAMDILRGTPSSLAALFEYLARDVMGRLPPDMTDFMRRTAVLSELSAPACDAITARADSAEMLHQLSQRELFVVGVSASSESQTYRYHHLFHDFLRAQLNENAAQASQSHLRAANFFEGGALRALDAETAIHHYLQAAPTHPPAYESAARAMERAGETLVRGGQLDTLVRWIDALPADVLAAHPALRALMGDVYRLRSKFDDALRWYADAEQHWRREHDAKGISRALRGQASVYLDTVRPREAEGLLSEALRYAEGTADAQDTAEARARLLELLAENKLNMGKPDEAERLREEARKLRETGFAEDVLSVRVKLRTGRLDEARDILENWVRAEREQTEKGRPHPPRAHRESVLLLSLVQSLLGNAARAAELARDGIAIGETSSSPFITAVGHIRLAHACQLMPAETQDFASLSMRKTHYDDAIRAIQSAISLGDQLAVRRTRAEAMWSLTRAHGFGRDGDLAAAERAAQEGLDTARWAGDPWMGALIETALGGSYALRGHADAAIETLSRALVAFRECGDTFGRANARAWLCAAHLGQKQMERFAAHAEDLLAVCETHGYDFIFSRRALLGPPDPRRFAPVLLAARAMGIRAAYASRVLAELGLQNAQTHPGYQLRVQTLGGFRVWRGDAEVDAGEWRRDKARQLFQFLLMKRGKAAGREEIAETLWPDLTAEAAARDFKVALNALNKALEPHREPDAPFAYVQRDGSAYFVSPGADMRVDAAQFEREAELGLKMAGGGTAALDEAIRHLQNAVDGYGGDYLPEAQYEDWSSEERERLQTLFLRAADRLAGLLIERGQCEAGMGLCERILARDGCWEHAYRMMMTAYAKLNLVPMALKVYQRCAETLKSELGIAPSAATQAVYEELLE